MNYSNKSRLRSWKHIVHLQLLALMLIVAFATIVHERKAGETPVFVFIHTNTGVSPALFNKHQKTSSTPQTQILPQSNLFEIGINTKCKSHSSASSCHF